MFRLAIRHAATKLSVSELDAVAGGVKGSTNGPGPLMQCDVPTDCWIDGLPKVTQSLLLPGSPSYRTPS